MPKIGDMVGSDMEQMKIAGSNFGFSGVKIDDLGASEYTLVTVAVDTSGSTHAFIADLIQAVKTIVDACKKSPRAENLMIRIIRFDSRVVEVHGFKLLSTIDPSDYDNMAQLGGMTALFDATFSSMGSVISYAETLTENNYDVNGICFVITDGMDNNSTTTPKMIAGMASDAIQNEQIESLVTVLIGVNVSNPTVKSELAQFNTDANFTQYIDAGDATPGTLAKLADFVSRSISSQSQSLGTGGPSQTLTF